ncbi:hypothetical protein DPX16_4684 [Anabarilius grahami]|uniref:Uncharacterized protein n=1 Tax=Anabarilius grahami TaxID=495550 RepID=A0A3N0YHT8_ANAGA|nr:hypothetical protein DPX16_4684 [Anabarilius grahami]
METPYQRISSSSLLCPINTAAVNHNKRLQEENQLLHFNRLTDQLWWILALFVIMVVLICFILRKMIFRCFQREVHEDDPEIMDPEAGVQLNVRTDDPHSLQFNGFVSRG